MVRSIHLSHPGCPDMQMHRDLHPDCGRISNIYIFVQVVHMYNTIQKRIYGFAYINTGNY